MLKPIKTFEEYANKVWIFLEFRENRVILFPKGKKFFCYLIIVLYAFEVVKNIFHGKFNNHIYRLYLVDFVVTCISILYLLFIRLNLYLIRNDNEIGTKKFQYLYFLKYKSNDQLVETYGFSREDAINYNKIVYYLINLTKLNEYMYIVGILFVILRITIVALFNIDLKYFILISIPNACSLLITASFQINTMSCFYLTFWINCIFTHKFLKSSITRLDNVDEKMIRKRNNEQLIDNIAAKNVSQFNYILRLFTFIQNDADYTIATYYIGMVLVDILIPYIIVLADNDKLSLFMVVSLYIQTTLFCLYTVAYTNTLLVDSFNDYSNALHRFIIKCPSIKLKLKLSNFFSINQKDNHLTYKCFKVFNYSRNYFIRYFLESFSLIFLVLSFASYKKMASNNNLSNN